MEEQATEEAVERVDMTREELDALLQSEADKRVTAALKKKDAEFKKQLKQETEEARREAEELAQLSAAERVKAEQQKERERFESERSEFEKERLQLQVEKELSAKGLPITLAPYILRQTAEETFEAIGSLETAWQEAIEAGVHQRLKGKAPKLGGAPTGEKRYTREEVEAMSQAEVKANLPAIRESMKDWT